MDNVLAQTSFGGRSKCGDMKEHLGVNDKGYK